VPARTSRIAEAFSSASRGASSRATSRSSAGSVSFNPGKFFLGQFGHLGVVAGGHEFRVQPAGSGP